MNFGGVIEEVVTREEFPLEKAREILKDETIAVIGYGVQGPGQACNLRDNGFNVIVGQRQGKTYEKAIADGWVPGETLFSIEEAAEKASIVMCLLSDAAVMSVWPTLKQYLTAGKALYFSHGFAITWSDRTGCVPQDDIDVIMARDPAAVSRAEVLFLYSGLHARIMHRLSHALNERGMKFGARAVSQFAKFLTGIEIHPGAKIGKHFFIDHGTGVVIGETAVVGDNCTIYQGVTLGGTGKDTGKRHPTLGDNVMVGAGAKVLGPFKIGDGAKIAAGGVVLKEIPAGATAVGIPAKVVRRDGEKVAEQLDQIHIPDPVSQQLGELEAKIEELKNEISELKKD